MANNCPPTYQYWKLAEDKKLYQLVRQHGPYNWNSIAEKIEGRTGKSCRLRWIHHLDPRLNKNPFTEEEEERLLAAHDVYGNRWTTIAKLFRGRTDNAVKNQWHSAMRRKRREESKKRSFQDLNNGSSISISSESLPNNEALDKTREPFFGSRMTDLYSEEMASCSSEKVSKDSGMKEVPFYDFLGVGGSDDQ